MAAFHVFMVLFMGLQHTCLATSCDDESCMQDGAAGRSLLHRLSAQGKAMVNEGNLPDGLPDGCADFAVETSPGQIKFKGKQFYNAAAVTGVRWALGVLKDQGRKVISGTSFVGTVLFGIVGDAIFPDPKLQRLRLLEQGMKCLSGAVSLLKDDINDLALTVGSHSLRPLKRMSTDLKSQTESHLQCETLMKCAADVKFMSDRRYDDSYCEDEINKKFAHYELSNKRVENCNALAFQQKFVQHNDYHFLREDFEHLVTDIKKIIGEHKQDQYVVAHSILVAYNAVAAEVYMAGNAVEAWATAICSPFGKHSPLGKDKSTCSKDDEDLIRDGLSGFKKWQKEFVDNLVAFAQELSDAPFMKKRQDSIIHEQIRKIPREGSPCGLEKTDLGERKTPLQYTELLRWDFNCSTGKLEEVFCGAPPCTISIPNPPFGCTKRKCKEPDYNHCTSKRRGDQRVFECKDCGWVECRSTMELTVRYDHLAEHMKEMHEISGNLSSRPLHPPPYQIEGSYNLSWPFCEDITKVRILRRKYCAQ